MLESRSAAKRRSRHGWLKNSTNVCCCSSYALHKKQGAGSAAGIQLTLYSCWSGPCALRCLCRSSHHRERGPSSSPPAHPSALALCSAALLNPCRRPCRLLEPRSCRRSLLACAVCSGFIAGLCPGGASVRACPPAPCAAKLVANRAAGFLLENMFLVVPMSPLCCSDGP